MKAANPASRHRPGGLGGHQADIVGPGAAFAESASFRQVQQRWGHTGNLVKVTTALVAAGHGTDESAGVRVQRTIKDIVDTSLFDDPSGVHDANLVGQAGDNG